MSQTQQRSRRQLVVHTVIGVFIFSLWLVPIAYVGITNRPIPAGGKYLNYLWRIAALFPSRSNAWDDYFYQVRLHGSEDWIEVSHEQLGTMRPFGAGNRIHRIMAQGGGDQNRAAVLRSVGDFVRRRFESLHPESEKVSEVRFLRVRYPVGSPRLTRTPGRWEIPALSEVPELDLEVWRQFRFEELEKSNIPSIENPE